MEMNKHQRKFFKEISELKPSVINRMIEESKDETV